MSPFAQRNPATCSSAPVEAAWETEDKHKELLAREERLLRDQSRVDRLFEKLKRERQEFTVTCATGLPVLTVAQPARLAPRFYKVFVC